MLQTEKVLTGTRADNLGDSIDSVPPSAETFKATVDFLRRHYPVIAFAVVIAVTLGLVYMITAAPRFTATATLMIDTKKVQLFGQQSVFTELPVDTSMVESQVEILKSESIALAVIKKLNLTEDPEFAGGGGLIGSLAGVITGLFSEPKSEFTLQREAVATFTKRLSVKRVPLTYIILIGFTSFSPDRAADIANAVANAYIDDQLEAKYDSARRASVWLQARLNELREQASAAESAVVVFKNKNDMVDAGGRTINEQQLAEINSQMLIAQSQSSEARAKLDRVQAVLSSDDPDATVVATVADTLKNDVVIKLRTQYLEMAARERDWANRYGSGHLAVVNLRNQMREIQNSIRNELQRIAETYKSDLEIATQHEQSLRKQLSDAVAQSQVTGEAQVSLRDLESKAQTYRALYDNFLQRYMESVQQQSFPITEARVITAATRPLFKSSPKLLVVLGLAAVLGCLVGGVLAGWREFVDQVFRTVEQVENVLQTDCVALVPLVRSDKTGTTRSAPLAEQIGLRNLARIVGVAQERGTKFVRALGDTRTLGFSADTAGSGELMRADRKDKIQANPLKSPPKSAQIILPQQGILAEIVRAPFSPFAESIRSIKVAIDQSPTADGGRIIGFTSSVPNEGKSSVAAAVARWMAQTGARTLLVDCDVRNPTLSRLLSPGVTAGLLESVRGQTPFEKVIWSDPDTGMKFLPVAMKGRFAHSSEMLASPQMRKFLDGLRSSFDYVVVDFSPLMPVVDVRVSTNLVDSYIYVVAWGETRIEFVKRALRSARGVYERLLGVVLNKADLTSIGRYESSGGYYTHSHYARYGYTE